jgi:uncharacterized protein YndB with AHSA1/START domain
MDILHRIGVESSSVDDVYRALSTIDGLSSWWTEDTRGDSEVGGLIEFRFVAGTIVMKVLELEPGRRVRWEGMPGGPEEWVGTTISFDLEQDGDFTIVLFKHEGWKEDVPFMYHCSTKWAVFLQSLKLLLETGAGAPAPGDVQVSNWH